MVELPSVNASQWRVRDWLLDIAGALFGLGLTALLGIRLFQDDQTNRLQAWGTAVFGLGILSVSAYKALRSRSKELRFEPFKEPSEIVGWAEDLYSKIDQYIASHSLAAGEIRVAVHKVHYDRRGRTPVQLEQIISYIGGDGGPPGRRSSVKSGIIGLAARIGDPIVSSTDQDGHQFVEEMVQEWGYTREEARALTPGRRSWLAMPITDTGDGPVVGVVYVDSVSTNLVDDAGLQEICWQCTQTLAKIVSRCYAK